MESLDSLQIPFYGHRQQYVVIPGAISNQSGLTTPYSHIIGGYPYIEVVLHNGSYRT